VLVSCREPAARFWMEGAAMRPPPGIRRRHLTNRDGEIMDAVSMGMPNDVLIVEDDAIIALDFEDTILGFGVKTVRTAGSVARALKLIGERAPDFALLDVALAREKSFVVAERLQAMKIPFVFITGYGSKVALPPALRDAPTLPKPCTTDVLEAALRRR
jgi:DNA-binding NtrC family response regulator